MALNEQWLKFTLVTTLLPEIVTEEKISEKNIVPPKWMDSNTSWFKKSLAHDGFLVSAIKFCND